MEADYYVGQQRGYQARLYVHQGKSAVVGDAVGDKQPPQWEAVQPDNGRIDQRPWVAATFTSGDAQCSTSSRMAASTVAPVLIHVIDQDWCHVLDVAHQVVRFNVDPGDPAFAYNCDREPQQRGVSLD